jgi:hypothetical protein
MSAEPQEALFRAWRATSAPRPTEAGRARFLTSFAEARRTRRSRWAGAAWMAAAAIAACVAAIVWWRTPAPLTFRTPSGEGETGAWLATEKTRDLPLAFSEGTSVVLAADSRGRVESTSRSGATFLLERGRVRATVVHRAETSWRFRAGPFDVRVTGTALDVGWDPSRERLVVRVDEGAVVVEGPRVGAVQVVRAGERCVVDLASRTTRVSSIADDAENETATDAPDAAAEIAPVVAPDASVDVAAPQAASANGARAPSWTTFEERGDYAAAYAAATRAGWGPLVRASSADELLRLAQVAQLAGHASAGREALLACRRRFPRSEQGAVAAYEIGRTSSPAEASRWFAAYVKEQPSGPLAREASGRLVESLAAAGDASGARDAAAKYLARYPDGPHAALARRVLAGPAE